ncbi:MAG: tetratricopeptide repeat protein [Chlorobi bacterium]|nr:tetratricopeptide repeat protein [Chlorobiota bacterium]
MKKVWVIVLIFGIWGGAQAQGKYDRLWQRFFENEFEEVHTRLGKKNPAKLDMEGLILYQLAREADGKFRHKEEFYPAFVSQPDWPYYLFALWKRTFFFDVYNDKFFDNFDLKTLEFLYRRRPADFPEEAYELDYLYAMMLAYRHRMDESRRMRDTFPHLRKWQLVGVFENLNESGMQRVYGPERRAVSPDGYDAHSHGRVNWFPARNFSDLPYFLMYNHTEYGPGINYAQTFLTTDSARTVYLKISRGGPEKVWLNDVLVFEEDENRETPLDAYTVEVRLPAGTSRLLVKLTNRPKSYFSVRLARKDGTPIEGIRSDSVYRPYRKDTTNFTRPRRVPSRYLAYFDSLAAARPDAPFPHIMRILAYLRMQDDTRAEKAIRELLKKYPSSTWLRLALAEVYDLRGREDQVETLKQNILRDDPDGFTALTIRMEEPEKFMTGDIKDLEEFIEKLKAKTDNPFLITGAELLLYARKNDLISLKKAVETAIDSAMAWGHMDKLTRYTMFLSQVFKEYDREIEILQKAYKQFNHPLVFRRLISAYRDLGKDSLALDVYLFHIREYPSIVSTRLETGKLLIDMQRYQEALAQTDTALMIFPWSFKAMEQKGDILRYLGDPEGAVEWYRKALSHNPGNLALRRLIDDILGKEDIIKKHLPRRMYDLIRKRRGKRTDRDYAYSILYSGDHVLLYNEGAIRHRVTRLYEIHTEQGLEAFKEINLDLGGEYYIHKSEAVKADGSVVPADRAGDRLVFTRLDTGDVVYLDYEWIETNRGRFYRDYTSKTRFGAYVPVTEEIFTVFIPEGRKLYYKYLKDSIPLKIKNKGEWVMYRWSRKDIPPFPPEEDYMPPSPDVHPYLAVSTLYDWSLVARWYADLSAASLKADARVKETFAELFPEGHRQLDPEERARRIYKYITDNIRYSYVDFRQSGKIPQKPSKTIETRLGDCKDMSALFVTLARLADLKAHLVLVRTNDYGRNALVLPSTAFNHAIARVDLPEGIQYVELTDKYLPYGALPVRLPGACALDIPYKSDTTGLHRTLYHLDSVRRTPNVLEAKYRYKITEGTQHLTVDITATGANVSDWRDILEDENETNRKEALEDYFENMDDLDLELKSYRILEDGRNSDTVRVEITFDVRTPLQELNDILLFKLPLQLPAYTPNLIGPEERHYPIRYIFYENTDRYGMDYTIELDIPGKRFTFIPRNDTLQWGPHRTAIAYTPAGDTLLRARIDIRTPLERDVMPEEYPAFKEYVRRVLKRLRYFIGFR